MTTRRTDDDRVEAALRDLWPPMEPTPAAQRSARRRLDAAIAAEIARTNPPSVSPDRGRTRVTARRLLAAAAVVMAIVVGGTALSISVGGDGPDVTVGSPAAAVMDDLGARVAKRQDPAGGGFARLETIGDADYRSVAYFLPDGSFLQSRDGEASFETVTGLYPTLEVIQRFPTEPAGVPAALDEAAKANRDFDEIETTVDQRRVTELMYLLWDPRLPNPQRAALYRWLGSLPYAELEGKTTDATGRAGIAISVAPEGFTPGTIVFDPETGATLETRSVKNDSDGGLVTETYVSARAVDALPATS